MSLSDLSYFSLQRASRIRPRFLALICIVVLVYPLAEAQPTPAAPATKTLTAAQLGERKFKANCGRCHTAPEQISPRIAGTVLRHMRVRASLSAEDERQILHYLAP